MARIGYLVPIEFYPTNGGLRWRCRQLCEALAAAGHTVELHARRTFQQQYVATAASGTLRPRFEVDRPLRFTTLSEYRYLENWVRERELDLLVATHPYYPDLVPLAKAHGIPIVIDTHNVESGRAMRSAHNRSLLTQWRIRMAERVYFPQAQRIWTISEEDLAAYRRLFPRQRVCHIPMAAPDTADITPLPRHPPEILFPGLMSYLPNAQAGSFLLEQVLPLVSAEHDVRLVLAGRDPPAEWLARYGNHPNVEITGEVADISEYFRRAAVIVAPIPMGGGLKIKVLEAMAFAKPLVATAQAMTGVKAAPEEHYLEAPFDAHGFAAAVSRLIGDEALRRRLGTAARAFIAEHHSPATTEAAIASEIASLAP